MSAHAGVTLGKLAERIGGRLEGDPAVEVFGVRSVEGAREGDLAVVFDRRHAAALPAFAGSALILPEDPAIEPPAGRPTLRVPHPRRALVDALHLLHPESRRAAGVDPGASVSRSASVDSTAFIGPGAVVEEGASVGPRSEIHANSVVGAGVAIGTGTIVFPNVTLYPGVRLGDRVRVHAGTVIGSDGFGFPRGDDGTLSKVPQVGTVVVEDDVEIGANCAIDRATLEETRIGRGTKIDNLVQIGHNAEIGPDCCIMGQVGISGSVRIGARATLCGQVGIADQVRLPEGVVVGAQAGVPHDLTAGVWLGTPAILATRARRVFPALARLPETRQELRELAERVAVLEEMLRSGHESD